MLLINVFIISIEFSIELSMPGIQAKKVDIF